MEDGDYLCSLNRDRDALPLYNHAYDIAKDKLVKKEIALAKRKALKVIEAEEEALKREEFKKERRQVYEEKKSQADARKDNRTAKKANKEEINKLYKEALSYYYEDNLTQAQESFEKILSYYPDEKRARVYIDDKIPARKINIEKQSLKKEQKKDKQEQGDIK